MYATGRSVLKDDAEAVKWYRLAAEQGPAGAQYALGLSYRTGEGVLKDAAEAARWYRLAAEQGVASAQYTLGVMYAKGEGVLKDDAEAQYALGLSYGAGLGGVLEDSVLAHMWFNIAGANGNARARKLRNSFEREMTRAEVSRATELARVCMASDYQDCEL